MFETETTVEISLSRYTELTKCAVEAAELKHFLTDKLSRYGTVSHTELEMLESLGLIWRIKNVSDS